MYRSAESKQVRWALAGLALLAIASCSSRPDHFICDGSRWPVGEDQWVEASNISATLDLVPSVNRWIFRTPHYGHLMVDSNRHHFYVTSVSPEKIYFHQGSEAARTGGGQFDLINGSLSFAVGEEIHRLQCRRATPLAEAG